MKTKKIGFIGGGNMASSLISGLIASGHSPQQIWVSDIDADRLNSLAEKLKVNIAASNDTGSQFSSQAVTRSGKKA